MLCAQMKYTVKAGYPDIEACANQFPEMLHTPANELMKTP
jgi:hypothetical protein